RSLRIGLSLGKRPSPLVRKRFSIWWGRDSLSVWCGRDSLSGTEEIARCCHRFTWPLVLLRVGSAYIHTTAYG
ncbi:unnamed protein product, partial [Ectocarpus sp. 13 AM-2016]